MVAPTSSVVVDEQANPSVWRFYTRQSQINTITSFQESNNFIGIQPSIS